MAAQYDIIKAIVALWDDNDLDDEITPHWTAAERTRFIALNDTQGPPGQPFPHVVIDLGPPQTTGRSSGGVANQIYRLGRSTLALKVVCENISGQSAKSLASDLVDAIKAVYGGHPTTRPEAMVLATGEVLNCQFQRDFGMKTGDDEWTSVVEYEIETDVPEML